MNFVNYTQTYHTYANKNRMLDIAMSNLEQPKSFGMFPAPTFSKWVDCGTEEKEVEQAEKQSRTNKQTNKTTVFLGAWWR